MNKNAITLDGQNDDMFVDDRDDRISEMADEDTIPRYGANSLKRPKRALTNAEQDAMNRFGVPTRKST